jgi:pimeloyl-ACP methyl ester carboxylesterase
MAQRWSAIAYFLNLSLVAESQTVYVNGCASGTGNGSAASPFNTLTIAVERANPGSTLVIEPGGYPPPLTIRKGLTLEAPAGPVLIGGRFVDTQELCIPITETCGNWGSLNPSAVFCSSTPSGARAKIYFPAAGPGNPLLACRGPFPLIIYAHGHRNCDLCYTGPIEDDYQQADGILAPLAAAGFIVISLDVSWFEVGGANSEGAMLLNALAFARDENARAGSLLEGQLDLGRVGLAGHSTGGTAAIDAVALLQQGSCPSLNLANVHPAALGLLAPFLDYEPSSFPPTLVLYGTADSSQVGDDPLRVYAKANGAKHLVSITGANHYGYTDALCCGPGFDGVCQVGGAIGQEARRRQQLTARDYLVAFFLRYLRGDTDQSDYLAQSAGQQCQFPGNPPVCGSPRRQFDDLTSLNVEVGICSCAP